MPTPPPDSAELAAVLADPARLGAIEATGLTDSEPEEAFDRLTRLVQRCLRVPVALVSIVDDRRQFFKSHQGLAEPWCSLRETPLSHSFCQHVVVRDAPLVVEDARLDPLVRANLAVPDLNVVAYLGVPLRTPDGHAIGSLCAIDSVPRPWNDGDRESMEALAEAVMAEIATRYRLQEQADAIGSSLALSSALFDALFESTAHPLAVLRSDGGVARANGAALRFVGRPPEAVVGQTLWSVLSVDAAVGEHLQDAVARAREDEAVTFTEAVRDRDGTARDLRLGVRPGPRARGLLLFEAAPA